MKLPQITLIALTGLGYKTQEHLDALKKSCEQIEFGEVKLIQLGNIKDIDSWNRSVIYDLPKYVQTDYCIFIHSDGYIINPDLWQSRWLKYDYIGAPWPLPSDNFSYRDEQGEIQRVGNSVSLRSKKLMDLIATRPEEYFWSFKQKYGNCNEDGFITCHNRKWLESQGCKFAPIFIAKYFSKEHTILENRDIEKTFMFHQI